MAKFFVGQRVKLVRPRYPENMGKTGRIARLGLRVMIHDGSFSNCFVDWDDGDRDGISTGRLGRILSTHTDQLEPVHPDGHRAGEEGRCKPLDHLLSRLKGVEV